MGNRCSIQQSEEINCWLEQSPENRLYRPFRYFWATLYNLAHEDHNKAHIKTLVFPIVSMESAMFNDHHGTPTAFLTNFTKIVKLTETPKKHVTVRDETASDVTTCTSKKSWKLLESGFPDRYFGRSMLHCKHTLWTVGETGVSWHMGFVGTLRLSLLANYDFTKEYHLYKGTNNTHVHHIVLNLARPTLSE